MAVEAGPPRPARPASPWREILLVGSLSLAGWPVALLAWAFPFAVFTALFDRRLRIVAAPAAVALPLLLAFAFPGARFFVVAAALAVLAASIALVARPRVGYGELSLCALGGLAGAAAAWLLVQPAFFAGLRAALETATLAQGRSWVAWLEGRGLAPETRLALEQAMATSAGLWARTWPAAAFAASWLGLGAALRLAAAAARREDGPAARVRVAERCALFRAPDLWVWAFLLGVAAFLAGPEGGAVHDAGLNLALVAAGVFAWQGVAVGLYFLERRMRPIGRTLLLAVGALLLPIPIFVAALGVGLADVRFDFRARRPPASSG